MIGLILWLILIFIIAVCTTPGFFTALCVSLLVAFGVYFGIYLIIEHFRK